MFFKKAILLSVAAAVWLVAVPTAASATVKHSGVALKTGENPHMLFTGSFAATGEAGSLTCPSGVEATVKLTGGTNVAHPESVEITEPEECEVGGLLGVVCGENSFTASIFTKSVWTYDAMLNIWIYDRFVIDLFFAECVVMQVEGELAVTPDNPGAITKATLSGEMESEFGEFEVSGTFNASPAGTYGY